MQTANGWWNYASWNWTRTGFLFLICWQWFLILVTSKLIIRFVYMSLFIVWTVHNHLWIFLFRFHTFNAARVSETVPPGSDIPDEELYARPPADSRSTRGWLVDLINRWIDKMINSDKYLFKQFECLKWFFWFVIGLEVLMDLIYCSLDFRAAEIYRY